MFGWFGTKEESMKPDNLNNETHKHRKSLEPKPGQTADATVSLPQPVHAAAEAAAPINTIEHATVIQEEVPRKPDIVVTANADAIPAAATGVTPKSGGNNAVSFPKDGGLIDLLQDSRQHFEELIVTEDEDTSQKTWEQGTNGLVSMIGFAVGISNIWKFPYLCWRYGGITFLIPYFFFLITCAFPVMYLEVIMGQLIRKGMMRVWDIAPILRGIGYCQSLLPLLIAFNYNAIYAWCLFYCYIVIVGGSKAPWAYCTNSWNTDGCKEITPDFEDINLGPNERRAGEEFFKGRVQRLWESVFAGDFKESSGKRANAGIIFGLTGHDKGLGWPGAEMWIALFVVYCITFMFTYQGLGTKGKLVWYANCGPYLVMIILIYRAIGMPGTWSHGLYFFFDNKNGWRQLLRLETWTAAAIQAFSSTGAGLGVHLTFGSYNAFNRNCFSDVVITLAVDTITSIIAMILIFMYVGTIVYSDGGTDAQDVLKQGPELIFSVMADALGRLPGPFFFCSIFFLMVFLIGYTSNLAGVVCAKVSLFDGYSKWFGTHGQFRAIVILAVLTIGYFGGVIVIARGGIDVFELLDHYTAGVPMFFTSFIKLTAFIWIYGIDLVVIGCQRMTGRRPGWLLQFCWTYVCPFCLLALCIVLCLPSHNKGVINPNDNEKNWRYFQKFWLYLGAAYQYIPLLLVLLGAFFYILNINGRSFKQILLMGISPPEDYPEIIKTNRAKRASFRHYFMVMTFCFRKQIKVLPVLAPVDPKVLEQKKLEETLKKMEEDQQKQLEEELKKVEEEQQTKLDE